MQKLLKSQQLLAPFRRSKVKDETLQKRKEWKKLKMVNTYSAEYTNEKPPHSWLDHKKLKQLFQAYQTQANMHRKTFQVDEKDKQTMIEKCTNHNEIEYRNYQLQHYDKQQFQLNINQVKKEIETLPYNLKNELKIVYNKDDIIENFDPEEHEFYNLYYDQLMRLLPESQTNRLRLSNRLEKIANDKLQTGE